MKRIENLDAALKDINGTDVGQMKDVFANSIAQSVHPQAAIAMNVALRILNSNGSVELDEAEFRVVSECIRNNTMTVNYAKVAMLEALDAADKETE